MIDAITLTGQQVLYIISSFGALILGIILFAKIIFQYRKKRGGQLLSQKYKKESRVKYPSLNPFNYTRQIKGLSLAISLSLIYTLFAWTVKTQLIEEYASTYEVEEIIETKRTKHPTKKLNKITENLATVDEIIAAETVEEPDYIDEFVDEYIEDEFLESQFAQEGKTEEQILPPPIPPREESDAPIIFAEQMPRFPGCKDDKLSKKEKEKCSKDKLLEFIYSKIKYPQLAKEIGISGTVYTRFVVSKGGQITDIEILRSPHKSLGKETLRVIELINHLPEKWEPGRQNGRPVGVLYTIPIKFKLR